MKKRRIAALFLISLALLLSLLSVQSSTAPPKMFNSFFYTPSGAILFSYHDETYIIVKDSSGFTSWNGTLNKGDSQYLNISAGIYFAAASEPYALITGNPQTQNVVGYFAVDSYGRGTSTELYTYIPPPSSLYDGSKFIIFAYTNSTTIKVTDPAAQAVMWQGTLDEGKHFSQDLNNATWQNKTVHIESSNPISALCYLDQGFIVPSANGFFTGTLFYTFASNITNGNNDLNVIGYQNDTWVSVTNTVSQALIWNGTLNEAEVHSEVFNSPTYLTVISNQSVAVTVDPYKTWPILYLAALYAADSNGGLIGTRFFTTERGGGYLSILSYNNDTYVEVVNPATSSLLWNGTLNEMQLHIQTLKVNDINKIYEILSDKPVSVIEGYGEPSDAMFAPLYYTSDTQPPTIGVPSILPQNPVATQDIQVTVDVFDDLSGVQKVVLSYTADTVWQDITMDWIGGNTYTANIPTLFSQTEVKFTLTAYDNVNNAKTSDQTTIILAPLPTPTPTTTPTPTPPTPTPTPTPTPPSPTPAPTSTPTPTPPPTLAPTTPTPTPTSTPTQTQPSSTTPTPTTKPSPTSSQGLTPSNSPNDSPSTQPTTTPKNPLEDSLPLYIVLALITLGLIGTALFMYQKRKSNSLTQQESSK